MATFKDHFSAHAAQYAAHRPTYPPALVDALADLAGGTRLALDCGCGTGQLSVPLAVRFDRVIAIDGSAAQIAAAERHPRVEYRVALAESSGLPARTVDLVTVAQAAHWFDLTRFYAEVRRVGRTGGLLALVTYGNIDTDPDVVRIVQDFRRDVIDRFWPPERIHVDTGYRQLLFPFEELEPPTFALEQSWSLSDFLGYIDTWSAVRAAEAAMGRAPLETFADMLRDVWGPPETRKIIRWPLSMRLGRL